jgi:hypothetical protein
MRLQQMLYLQGAQTKLHTSLACAGVSRRCGSSCQLGYPPSSMSALLAYRWEVLRAAALPALI